MLLIYRIPGDPRTKKNHQQLARTKDGRVFPVQNKPYKQYEAMCRKMIQPPGEPISTPVNVSGLYYMGTRRKVDLLNLLGASLDILVNCGVLADDNSNIVVSHDGSRVLYDKDNPRAVITITDALETSLFNADESFE